MTNDTSLSVHMRGRSLAMKIESPDETLEVVLPRPLLALWAQRTLLLFDVNLKLKAHRVFQPKQFRIDTAITHDGTVTVRLHSFEHDRRLAILLDQRTVRQLARHAQFLATTPLNIEQLERNQTVFPRREGDWPGPSHN
jgi:hypothetical protein